MKTAYNESMDPQSSIKSKPSWYRLVIVFVFILIAFILFFLYENTKNKFQENNFSVNPTQPLNNQPTTPPTEGLFSLKTIDGNNKVAQKELQIDLIASSETRPIVGYDVVVAYDSDYIDILSAQSLISDFNSYTSKKKDQYAVTGAKKLTSSDPIVFDHISILRFTVLPKKKGTVSLKVVSQLGAEKSQMVDDKTHIMLPFAEALTLEIQ